jgi:ribosomal-protein-alanine N-acetyltransferase
MTQPLLRSMAGPDVDTVLSIEQRIQAYPWTRGNFADALASGNLCKVYQYGGEIIGYAVLLPAVDEMHLLNFGIAPAHQRQGWGRRLLGEVMALARTLNMGRLLLEARPSNRAALGLYREAGFAELGLRVGYYPADNGREDAVVLGCRL